MDRLETLLSDTLAERASQAPTGPVPLAERALRTGNTIAIVAGSLVVVAVAVVAVILGAPSRTHPSNHHGTPTIQQDLPDGMRLASYGQASVGVPAELATRTSLCGGPVANEVVALDGSASLCPVATSSLASHPGTVIWLSDAQQATPYANIPTSPAEVDGHPVQRGYATNAHGLGAGVSGVVRLPEQSITIGVTAPTRRAVDVVLSSIRIAPLDPLGCAASLSAASKTPAGPSGVLVPADSTTAVRCEYGTDSASGLLIGSYTLDPSKTGQLVAALNDLIPDPCHCVHGGTTSPGHDEVLYFHYRDGSVLRVNGAIGANLDTYTNQGRTVANYSSSITQLLAKLTNQR
jgi:hypothetical protein